MTKRSDRSEQSPRKCRTCALILWAIGPWIILFSVYPAVLMSTHLVDTIFIIGSVTYLVLRVAAVCACPHWTTKTRTQLVAGIVGELIVLGAIWFFFFCMCVCMCVPHQT